MSNSKVWLDGKLVPEYEALVPFSTHALHYGSAVFEGIRFYETEKGPAIFRLKEHDERLFYSAESLNMKIPYNQDEVSKAIIQTVKESNLQEGYIRPLVFYGDGKIKLNPSGLKTRLGIMITPMSAYLGEKPVKLKTSPWIRIHPKSLNNHAKVSGHYVNSIISSLDAKEAGFDESLLLDYEGNIAEGPGANIFFVKNNLLVTPPKNNILPGITRDAIIKIALDNNYKVREIPVSPDNIEEFDEAFFTGTAAEVTSITSIDNKSFKSDLGEVTKFFKEKYSNIVHGKVPEYEHWLTYLNPEF